MNDLLVEKTQARRTIPSDSDLKIKKILVAVDLSPHSERTAAYAAEFAARFGASLTLIHVCSPKETETETSSKDCRFDDPMIAPEKKLEDLARKVRRTYPTCSAYLYVGDPAEKIVMTAKILGADLILTGSRYAKSLAGLLGLDQPSRIVHRAPCPVLVYHDSN
jgi:nucleotide-binding universal stress UspA family protein